SRPHGISAVSLSPDAELLAIVSAGQGELLRLENARTRTVDSFEGNNVAFSPDGSQFGIVKLGKGGSSINIYRTGSSDKTNALDVQGEVSNVKISPDNKLLFVIGSAHVVEVREIHGGKKLASFSLDEEVTDVTVDPTSQFMATASSNG